MGYVKHSEWQKKYESLLEKWKKELVEHAQTKAQLEFYQEVNKVLANRKAVDNSKEK